MFRYLLITNVRNLTISGSVSVEEQSGWESFVVVRVPTIESFWKEEKVVYMTQFRYF